MPDIDLDKERGDLARYKTLREAGTTAPEAYTLMEAEGLSVIASMRLLRGVYGLTLEQAKEATGGGTPFKTAEDTAVSDRGTRLLRLRRGRADCVPARQPADFADPAEIGEQRRPIPLLCPDATIYSAG